MRSVTRSNVVRGKVARSILPPFGLPKRQKNNRNTSQDQRVIPMFRYLSYALFSSPRIFLCSWNVLKVTRGCLCSRGSVVGYIYICFLISYLSEYNVYKCISCIGVSLIKVCEKLWKRRSFIRATTSTHVDRYYFWVKDSFEWNRNDEGILSFPSSYFFTITKISFFYSFRQENNETCTASFYDSSVLFASRFFVAINLLRLTWLRSNMTRNTRI